MRSRVKMWPAIAGLLFLLTVGPVAAAPDPASVFQRTWAGTDQPVAIGRVGRTWMWGPKALSGILSEPYTEAPGGSRQVIYYDKARMEITHPAGDPNSLWYVTNGLLAQEMVTGALQLGDSAFQQCAPAAINVAGDLNDPNAPTYASFTGLLDSPPLAVGTPITATIDRAGQVGQGASLESYGVAATMLATATNHTVASVFWSFMNSSGIVDRAGADVNGRLFSNPFYATGYPITEAYWTTVQVAGVPRQVLVQVFQRRVMTFTPSNPVGWQVESGNVGQHYYDWRYHVLPGQAPLDESAPPAPVVSPSAAPATVTSSSGSGTSTQVCASHQTASGGSQTAQQIQTNTVAGRADGATSVNQRCSSVVNQGP